MSAREEILQKIHAVRLLLPGAVVDQAPADKSDVTFVDFIFARVNEAKAGLTLSEIGEALKASPLRERYKNNPNAVYTAVGRLVERNRVVRAGRMVYSPQAYQRVIAGQVEERTETVEPPAMTDLVLKVVGGAGKGLTSGEILDVLRKDEAAAARLTSQGQVGYNTISRLTQRGKLVKNGNVNSLPGAPPEVDPGSLL
jgi:hypothetical protein